MHSAGTVVSLTTRPVVGALVTAAAYWLGTQIGLLLTPSQLAVFADVAAECAAGSLLCFSRRGGTGRGTSLPFYLSIC